VEGFTYVGLLKNAWIVCGKPTNSSAMLWDVNAVAGVITSICHLLFCMQKSAKAGGVALAGPCPTSMLQYDLT